MEYLLANDQGHICIKTILKRGLWASPDFQGVWQKKVRNSCLNFLLHSTFYAPCLFFFMPRSDDVYVFKTLYMVLLPLLKSKILSWIKGPSQQHMILFFPALYLSPPDILWFRQTELPWSSQLEMISPSWVIVWYFFIPLVFHLVLVLIYICIVPPN